MNRIIKVGGIYHVLNRGVDKRKIFMNDKDYLRFIHDLFEFNNQNPLPNNTYLFKKNKSEVFASPNMNSDLRRPKVKPRKLLVEVLVFCLMPNHYHLLVRPKTEGSLTKFMKRLNMGYAKYFNEKYKRTGALFEGRYKAVEVNQESHFIHLPYYIHLNPLDLVTPEWRESKLNNYQKAVEFLEQYRWSSFLDYIGKGNFPSITQREFLLELFDGPAEYKKSTYQWLKDLDMDSIDNLDETTLESFGHRKT